MPQNTINDKSAMVRVMLIAVRQGAIIWANVDTNICHQLASLGHNELIKVEEQIPLLEWALCLVLFTYTGRTHGQGWQQQIWTGITKANHKGIITPSK